MQARLTIVDFTPLVKTDEDVLVQDDWIVRFGREVAIANRNVPRPLTKKKLPPHARERIHDSRFSDARLSGDVARIKPALSRYFAERSCLHPGTRPFIAFARAVQVMRPVASADRSASI